MEACREHGGAEEDIVGRREHGDRVRAEQVLAMRLDERDRGGHGQSEGGVGP